MRAVRRTERGIEVVDAPRPRGEGVRVRIRSAGICQTDVNLAALGPMPQILGHELAGETEDGRPVAIEPFDPCGACADCAAGDYLYCERGAGMIFGVGTDGGMAEELVVPERAVVPLPAGVRPRDACLVEPLAVNLHSLALAGLDSGQRVAVVGGNRTGFGLLAVAGAAQRGCPVDFESEYEHQFEPALELGARSASARIDGGRYDLVIEGDGSEASIARAIEVCRPGGTLLLVAGYYSDKSFPAPACMVKELTMIWGTFYGHHAGGRDAEAAAALLARRPEIARTLITHRFPLEAAPEAFDLVRGPEASMKVVIEP